MNPDEYEVLFGDPPPNSRHPRPPVVIELDPGPPPKMGPEVHIEPRPAPIGFSKASARASVRSPHSTPKMRSQERPFKPNPWIVALASGSVAGVLFLGLLISADTPRQPQPLPCQEEVIYPAVLGTTELNGDSTTTASLDIDAIVTTTAPEASNCIPND